MAEDFTPDMLASPDDFTDDIIDSFNNPDRDKGTPTGLDNLDRILGGWRESELTIWSGRNSAGKSTLLNQVFLRLAESNIKGCIASFEMPVVRYLGWMARQYTGKAYPENWQVKEFTSWLSGKTYILNSLDSLTPAVILDTFEYASRRYGVKHFLIDSLMKVSFPGKEELKEHKLFINQLTSFAHKFKCHVHLVAHPRKGGRDSDRPGKVDIMGTGDITNLADNVLIMHRPDEEEKEASLNNLDMFAMRSLFLSKIMYSQETPDERIEAALMVKENIEETLKSWHQKEKKELTEEQVKYSSQVALMLLKDRVEGVKFMHKVGGKLIAPAPLEESMFKTINAFVNSSDDDVKEERKENAIKDLLSRS
jgi:twinkle protein